METNKQEIPEIKVELESKKAPKHSNFLPYLALIVLLVLLLLGSGYYFLQQPNAITLLDKIKSTLGFQPSHLVQTLPQSENAKDDEIRRLQDALYQKEKEVAALANSVQGLSTSVQEIQSKSANIATKLRYSIKPKKQIVAECYSMQIGSWDIPKSCLLAIATKVNAELENDKKVVAFEIQGVVDTNPYRGLSPELKQEGLASFRAWSAIREINAKLPNATAFEGPSLQLENKRGYKIKAYFVE